LRVGRNLGDCIHEDPEMYTPDEGVNAQNMQEAAGEFLDGFVRVNGNARNGPKRCRG